MVQLLGETGGELLLLGALLNRVANNRIPMDALCQSHRTHMMGGYKKMRKLLGAGEFFAAIGGAARRPRAGVVGGRCRGHAL